MFPNIFDRIDFLIRKYKTRYGLNKPSITWSEEELSELGYTMRTSVLKAQNKRRQGENKVVFLRYRKIELFNALDEHEKEEQFEDRAWITTIV